MPALPVARKRYSERDVIRALILTGHEIRCFRTKEVITLDTVNLLEREHVIPLALGGSDGPENAAYSLMEAHARQTNGSKATSYGSDKHAIAKVRRLTGQNKPKVKRGWPSKSMQSRPFPNGQK